LLERTEHGDLTAELRKFVDKHKPKMVALEPQRDRSCELGVFEGTALHKLHFSPSRRYSEDIDLVQLCPERPGDPGVRRALPQFNRICREKGFKIGRPPRAVWRGDSRATLTVAV